MRNAHIFTSVEGERERREREQERGMEREREREGERERGEKERERERKREKGRKRERGSLLHLLLTMAALKGMTGALAPFSYPYVSAKFESKPEMQLLLVKLVLNYFQN